MNKIYKVAEMLGVEIGEEFKLKFQGNLYGEIYRFDEKEGLQVKDRFCWSQSGKLSAILLGDIEIVKIPFEPECDENYFHVHWYKGCIGTRNWIWEDDFLDRINKYCGNVFRTKEEAERQKYAVYERITGKKWEQDDDR